MVPRAEVESLLVAVVDMLERWVPEERRKAELDNLIAAAQEVAGGLAACA